MKGRKSKNLNNIAIAIIVAVFAMLLMLFQFFYLGIILKEEAEEESQEIASLTAQEIAQSIQVYFRDALTVTETYSDNFLVYRQNSIPRQTIYSLMEGSLKLNPTFLAIWTMWEPNCYDGKDAQFANDRIHDPKGSFALAHYYDNGQIKQEINDTNDFAEDFYAIPKKYQKAVILDPFYYQYHGNEKTYFETSLVYPIKDSNRFLGVIGIDIDLHFLQKRFNEKTLYDSGYISILSNSGQIVTHKNEAFINRNIAEFSAPFQHTVKDSLKAGKAFVMQNSAVHSGIPVSRYYFPINMEEMAAPWYVMIEIPQDSILKKADRLKTISFAVLLASLILLLYLIYNILDRRIKEKTLLENFNQLKTSRHQLNEAYHELDQNKRILEAIFNQTYSFVALLSTEAKVVSINKSALDFIQRSESEIIGATFHDTPWWNTSNDKEHLINAIEKAKKGEHITFETTHQSASGASVPFLFSIKPISGMGNEVQFLLAEGIDIQKIKEAEKELELYRLHLERLVKERTEELATTNEELMANNEVLYSQRLKLEATLEDLRKTQEQLLQSKKMASLGILAAGIAHEINNPLNFIQGGSFGLEDYIKSKLPEHEATLSAYLAAINEGVSRAAKIVTSLNHYSRQNNNEKTECHLTAIIDHCLVMLHNTIKNRINVVKRYDENASKIIGNEGQLHQAFLNILSNAVQSIHETGEISISISESVNYINIEVQDNGYGIDPDDLPKIFDPFFTTKDPGKGTGLGLSITFNIIKDHQGSIDVESEKGKGTKVTVQFPL